MNSTPKGGFIVNVQAVHSSIKCHNVDEHHDSTSRALTSRSDGCYGSPPLGVEAVWEFQDFQELKLHKVIQKTHRKNQKTINAQLSCIHFVSNSISSCLIDLVLQMFIFPHLSIHQEVFAK